MERALDYISNDPDATWQGCVATAKGSQVWLSEAVEAYLKAPGNELWKCLERVRRYRSLHPGCGYVDARKYFLYVSQYAMLPYFRDLNDNERYAVRVFSDETSKAYAKKQESGQQIISLQAGISRLREGSDFATSAFKTHSIKKEKLALQRRCETS